MQENIFRNVKDFLLKSMTDEREAVGERAIASEPDTPMRARTGETFDAC